MIQFLVAIMAALLLGGRGSAAEKPDRKPWAVILCRFSDLPRYTPHPVSFYKEAFTEAGAGTGREFSYFRRISYGKLDMTGSKVFGWFNMTNHSTKDLTTLKYPFDRHVLHDWGVETARAHQVDLKPFFGVLVVFNHSTDSGAAGGHRVVLGYNKKEWIPTFNEHELGHGFDLDHSWSARPDVEYGDRWDIMSAMNDFTFKGRHGTDGPGMDAFNLNKLGCIPEKRIWRTDGKSGTHTITLAAVNAFDAKGYLMALIPPGAGTENTYIVEFRRKSGWDVGIPHDTILVHELRKNGVCYLVSRNDSREVGATEIRPGQLFSVAERKLTIKAGRFSPASGTARVTITLGE